MLMEHHFREAMHMINNKCHWCEMPTNNPTEMVTDGNRELVEVVFCDKCKKFPDLFVDDLYEIDN